jgi:hypothetical protein
MVVTRTLAGCLALLVAGSSAAQARIVCNEGYQRVNGKDISTPYCNDNYVAEVARSYGYRSATRRSATVRP